MQVLTVNQTGIDRETFNLKMLAEHRGSIYIKDGRISIGGANIYHPSIKVLWVIYTLIKNEPDKFSVKGNVFQAFVEYMKKNEMFAPFFRELSQEQRIEIMSYVFGAKEEKEEVDK